MEEVELFRQNQVEESPKWKHPEGVDQPSPSSPHKEKFVYLQTKYAALLAPKPTEKKVEGGVKKEGTVLGGGAKFGEGTLRGFTNGGLAPGGPSSSGPSSPSSLRGKLSRPHSLSLSTPREGGTLSRKKGVICDGVLEMKKGGEWKAYYVTVRKNRVLQFRDIENRLFYFILCYLFIDLLIYLICHKKTHPPLQATCHGRD